MIAYIDASVLLRVVLRQPDALTEWREVEHGVSSAFVTTESLRTLDRLRLRANLTDVEVASRRATILQLIASLELVEVDAVVLDRAVAPSSIVVTNIRATSFSMKSWTCCPCVIPANAAYCRRTNTPDCNMTLAQMSPSAGNSSR
jgi:hypothetical protein